MRLFTIIIAIFSLLSAVILIGCSTANIAKRGVYVNEDTIVEGMSRDEVLSLLGAPIESKKLENNKMKDFFRVEQGDSTGNKVAKGIFTTTLAVGSLGLSEVIAHPLTKGRQSVSIAIWYDQNEMVERTKIIEVKKNTKKGNDDKNKLGG